MWLLWIHCSSSIATSDLAARSATFSLASGICRTSWPDLPQSRIARRVGRIRADARWVSGLRPDPACSWEARLRLFLAPFRIALLNS